MILRRTANAGVLLTLDGVTILLDGVCRGQGPYLATPEAERNALYADPPMIVGFTHSHFDHFSRSFAQDLYQMTLRPILGPEGLLKEGLCKGPVTVDGVTVTPISSRHLGKAGLDTPHISFLIEGSRRILFAGDASPAFLKQVGRVDILIAPYPYVITPNGWRMAGEKCEKLVLVHMPEPGNDPDGLWAMVKAQELPGPGLYIPALGEQLEL